jgi:carbon-monoxide dehydrogenase small subunit
MEIRQVNGGRAAAGSIAGEQEITVSMVVNGRPVEQTTSTRRLLSDFLRHELSLHGTHVGCEHGVCGCCTVMVDGRSARSCLLLAAQCDGAEVVTVEGLSPTDGTLSVVQNAFRDAHGLQCGFCTPGFIVTVTEFLAENRGRTDFTDAELRTALAGNLCRCTGYQQIVAAVRLAAERMAAAAEQPGEGPGTSYGRVPQNEEGN